MNAGSVYVFDPLSGALLLSIANPEPGVGDLFGRWPSLIEVEHGGQIVIGVLFDDPEGLVDGGSVYLFEGLP
jgi:hypothetical protein